MSNKIKNTEERPNGDYEPMTEKEKDIAKEWAQKFIETHRRTLEKLAR